MPLRLKACPRCHGDLSLERDLGSYESWVCIQCGHEAENNGAMEVPRPRPVFSSNGHKVSQKGGHA